MSTDVSVMGTIQEKVKEKIKNEFASLIPDEVWEGMIQSVTQEMILDHKDRYGNNQESTIKAMIRKELTDKAQKDIKDKLYTLTQAWPGYVNVSAEEAVKKMVDENFSLLLASVQRGMVEMMVKLDAQALTNQLQNMPRY